MKRWLCLVLAVLASALAAPAAYAQNYNGTTVSCASRDGGYRECYTGFRGPPVLVNNVSDTRCEENRNWGSRRPGTVWVDDGCRGLFREGMGFMPPPAPGPAGSRLVRCESDSGAYRECHVNRDASVELRRQLSSSACLEGRTWGMRGNRIWVRDGCRGEFLVTAGGGGWQPGPGGPGPGGNYAITCESQDGRYNTCNWDSRYGRPGRIQQLSDTRCTEGYTWGFRGDEVWVDRGCRARFFAR